MEYVKDVELDIGKGKIDGRNVIRKTIGDDKITSTSLVADGSITTAKLADSAVTNAKVGSAAITSGKISYEQISITISAGQSSGTGTATSGSIIIGWRPAGNVDQFVDNISLSGTTITITLAANATADNQFVVILLKT